MNIILLDTVARAAFKPLSLTRSMSDFRMGCFTNLERWQRYLPEAKIYIKTADYLQCKYPLPSFTGKKSVIVVNSHIIPNPAFIQQIKSLAEGYFLKDENHFWAAAHISGTLAEEMPFETAIQEKLKPGGVGKYAWTLTHLTDIFKENGEVLKGDFKLIQGNSMPLHSSNQLIGPAENLFIEEGAEVMASILNTTEGPIYIGKNAKVMEGCMLRGPFALLENAQLKMGAKIYGATTVGPHCKVGGEVNNSILFGFSNKGHDGFLGNSVIGEWCNLGADTNTSNLKNNYGNVKIWHYGQRAYLDSGAQFAGLFMGDHSKSGINTMFNTGTVVGVAANIFGGGFPPKMIPSFSWGGFDPSQINTYDKAIEVAYRMMERRGLKPEKAELAILQYLFNHRAEEWAVSV